MDEGRLVVEKCASLCAMSGASYPAIRREVQMPIYIEGRDTPPDLIGSRTHGTANRRGGRSGQGLAIGKTRLQAPRPMLVPGPRSCLPAESDRRTVPGERSVVVIRGPRLVAADASGEVVTSAQPNPEPRARLPMEGVERPPVWNRDLENLSDGSVHHSDRRAFPDHVGEGGRRADQSGRDIDAVPVPGARRTGLPQP